MLATTRHNRAVRLLDSCAALAALWLVLAPARAAAPVPDTMAQRLRACSACHGPEGRAAADGYQPRIAGKPAAYLYQQLLNFREGRRSHAAMANLLAPLSDTYLREIAAHFAALDLPYPAPARHVLEPDATRLAERLVHTGDPARRLPACTACHGAALTGMLPARPGLLGLPRDYLIGQLGAWRTGLRQARTPDCMAQIARALAPPEIAALASWLAARPVPAPAHPAPAVAGPLPLDCGGAPP
jgi:cytochrome c553